MMTIIIHRYTRKKPSLDSIPFQKHRKLKCVHRADKQKFAKQVLSCCGKYYYLRCSIKFSHKGKVTFRATETLNIEQQRIGGVRALGWPHQIEDPRSLFGKLGKVLVAGKGHPLADFGKATLK